ncbi:MAG TPA: OmpA family protein [Candidatus Binatia bacterium]|nr:OmpA family protein [Candidatus Binatia bacterium]
MRSPMRGLLRGLVAAVLTLHAGFAGAQQKETPPQWYVGPFLGYTFPDSVRDADFGINLDLTGGYVLLDALSLEAIVLAEQVQRTSDHRYDYSYAGGLALALGTPLPGNPVFLLGAGAIYEDLIQGTFTSGYADLGVGYYLPFRFDRELWRVEARYNPVLNGSAYPDNNVIEDVRLNVGVLFGFGEGGGQDTYTPPASDEAPLPPSPPLADEDGDGVPDGSDRCPGTPRWVRADANGCVPDDDTDGVDNTKDCCPSTPAGAPVDGQGCPPPPAATPAPAVLVPPAETPPAAPAAPAPAPAGAPLADEDGDGVPDDVDKCPHTAPGLTVTAEGCVKVETVVLTNVHFRFNSDELTDEAYRILNSVAATLRTRPNSRLLVAGHADEIGSAKYNMALSQRRADSVREFIGYLGIDGDRLVTKAFGESQPVASNRTDEGRALNRRVEFKLLTP